MPPPPPNHQQLLQTSAEVKQGYTWRYFGLTLIISLMTGLIGFGASFGVETITKESRTVDVFSSTSGNLATIPQSVASNLEVYLDVSPGQKAPVKSLYKYDVTISNNSPFGLDDFTVFFEVPSILALSIDPIISSNPPTLLHQITVNRLTHNLYTDSYKVSLLNPHQSLTFSYFGYAKDIVGAHAMSATVEKKDWIQNNSQSANLVRDSLFDKKFSEFTFFDGILLIMVAGAIYLFIGLYLQLISRFFTRFGGQKFISSPTQQP
jgi:hypothetical protein